MPLALLALLAMAPPGPEFTLTILHTGPLRGQVQPALVNNQSIGGYPRLVTATKRFISLDPNPLLLGTGDTLGESPYSNTYHGLADLAFMNLAGYRACAVGEDDLSRLQKDFGNFARNAAFPLLSCNLQTSSRSDLLSYVKPSTIVVIGSQQVGIIGVTNTDSSLTTKDATDSVKREAAKLSAQGVNKIVLLSDLLVRENKALAEAVPAVDVIVQGHDSPIYGKEPSREPPDPAAKYPYEVATGSHRTLLLAAGDRGELLGRIVIRFDDHGEIVGWRDGKPIPMDTSIGDDPTAAALAAAFSQPIHGGR